MTGLSARGGRFELLPGDAGTVAIRRLADMATVGTITLADDSAGSLTIRSFCIDSPHRSYGAGSEAAWLLVRAAREAGYGGLRAWAPPSRGLAAYFWIRMGFRPRHGEGPEGGIWFERGLN